MKSFASTKNLSSTLFVNKKPKIFLKGKPKFDHTKQDGGD